MENALIEIAFEISVWTRYVLDEFSQQYLWVVCSGLDFLVRTQVRVLCEVIRRNVTDIAGVDDARRDVACVD